MPGTGIPSFTRHAVRIAREGIYGLGPFLRDVLDDGEEDIKKLEVMAEKRGISRRTLQRAAEAVGVVKAVKGFGKDKVSWWSIP